MNLEYSQPQANVTAAVNTVGGYRWEYENEDGETVSETTDAPSILQWSQYEEIKIQEHTEVKLVFSKRTGRDHGDPVRLFHAGTGQGSQGQNLRGNPWRSLRGKRAVSCRQNRDLSTV